MKQRSVEIKFGTLFRVREFGKPTDRIDVITNVCEGNYFFSNRVKYDETGELFLSPVGFGTEGPEDFVEVTGQMLPDEVVKAIERG